MQKIHQAAEDLFTDATKAGGISRTPAQRFSELTKFVITHSGVLLEAVSEDSEDTSHIDTLDFHRHLTKLPLVQPTSEFQFI